MVNSNKIKAKIIEMGLSQKELSLRLGISQSTVNLKINNNRAMSLEEAERISEILQIQPEQFGEYFFSTVVA